MIRGKRRRLINSQTAAFMNLVENFSRTGSDMAEVCDKAAFYMKEPLKGIIEEFVVDIRLYGDTEYAFGRIYKKLYGCKLMEVFKSFEICQRHEGNFADIVKDAKQSIRAFDRSVTTRRAIQAGARSDLITLLGAGVLVIMMLEDFLGTGVPELLCGSYIGMGIILYCIFCVVMMVVIMVKGD